MPVTAVGIRFSDNDFYNTLQHWCNNLVQMLEYRSYVPSVHYPQYVKEITKEYIEELFRKTIGSFYLMYQSDDLKDNKDNEQAIEYLETHPIHIYLNEEISEYLVSCDHWCNSEFYYWFHDAHSSDLTVHCI